MKIRQILSKPILDLIAEFILLTKEDKNEILEHQAKLLAIYWGQQDRPDFSQKDLCKEPRFGRHNTFMMETEMTRLDVETDDINRARKVVISRQGMPPDVPLVGKIAIDLEFLENDFLEALVKAQTGESILQTVDMLKDEKFEGDTEKLIVEPHDSGQIARNFIGKYDDDSDATVTAQACLHVIHLCAAMFDKDEVKDIAHWGNILDVLEKTGFSCLQAGADHLAALGHLSDARDMYQELPENFEPAFHGQSLDPFKTLLFDKLDDLFKNGVINEDVYEKGVHLLKKRFEQIDLSTLLNIDSQHEDLDLKERLRQRLSSAKK